MANFCAFIPKNLRPKATKINAGPTPSLSHDVGPVLTLVGEMLVLIDLSGHKKCTKILLGRVPKKKKKKKMKLYVLK
jgi:hypothetical protein